MIRMHLFADLRPYICTFANCEKELAQFPTRAAWADHEFTEHRIIRSWSCLECDKQCDSEIEWIQHLEKRHQRTFLGPKHQVAKNMAYKARAKPIEDEPCPLCQVVPGKSRREFVKHVGQHMEEIALMALPRDDCEESEADSTSTKSDSSPPTGPGISITLGSLPDPSCRVYKPTRTSAKAPTSELDYLKGVGLGDYFEPMDFGTRSV